MTQSNQKRRPLCKGTGAQECLRLRGSGQAPNYNKNSRRATRLVTITNDDGHFCGLEVAK